MMQFLLLILIYFNSYYSLEDKSLDVWWSFDENGEYEGWLCGIDSQLDCHVTNGELHATIQGSLLSETTSPPHIESPSMLLSFSSRHYVMLRMMYYGSSSNGRLLLKSGPSLSDSAVSKQSVWYEGFRTIGVDASSAMKDNPLSLSLDQIPQTYFLSNASSGVYVIYDLESPRWVNSIKILPLGNENSPRRCLLQRSLSSGVGPFETIHRFTLSKSEIDYNQYFADEQNSHPQAPVFQLIAGFENSLSRYWRIVFVDNYGGPYIGVREILFEGYQDKISMIDFPLQSDLQAPPSSLSKSIGSNYHLYYIPTFPVLDALVTQIRFEFPYNLSFYEQSRNIKYIKERFAIDFIGVVKAPQIIGVSGCLEKYSKDPSFSDVKYNVTSQVEFINKILPIHYFTKNIGYEDYAYVLTFDCPADGGNPITITGYDFGEHSNVYIDSKPCPLIQQYQGVDGRLYDTITCKLPSATVAGPVYVRVENGRYPGLSSEAAYLSYRTSPPPFADPPVISNLAASKVDLSWSPPGDETDHLSITGYKILWYQPEYPEKISNCTVGNVTITTIRGLEANTAYVFAIAAVAEGAYPVSFANLPTDLYGRRELASHAVIGMFSQASDAVYTLAYDLNFDFFNANSTLNGSAVSYAMNTMGPTGVFGSEGSYGLEFVGHGNIENCNVSSTCCDAYDATVGPSSCGQSRSVCAVIAKSNEEAPSINILTLDQLITNKGAQLPSIACGPTMRLTASESRQQGAVWYRRKMNVRDGFDTRFSFRISNPSQRCKVMDDVSTYCRSRGADGFAFVLHNSSPSVIGSENGSGLGYEGIENSLVIEVDTYFNFENLDLYENHIGIMTRVRLYPIRLLCEMAMMLTNI
jgi:hypothetical protein